MEGEARGKTQHDHTPDRRATTPGNRLRKIGCHKESKPANIRQRSQRRSARSEARHRLNSSAEAEPSSRNFYFADATSLITVSSGAVFSACFLASVRRSLILSPRLA